MAEPQEKEEGIEITTSVGGIKVHGQRAGEQLFQVFSLVGMTAILIWLIMFTQDSKAEHQKISTSLAALVEAQDSANYILTLSLDDRARLRLNMPEALRKKLRDQ